MPDASGRQVAEWPCRRSRADRIGRIGRMSCMSCMSRLSRLSRVGRDCAGSHVFGARRLRARCTRLLARVPPAAFDAGGLRRIRARFLSRFLRFLSARMPRGGRFCAPLVSAIPASYTRA
ncbi:hypothetical protein WS69_04155 [Burkholderia sp. BDU5]|nr:hypothetical protein WS69_04155 [Burkholderia sp. BDU5]